MDKDRAILLLRQIKQGNAAAFDELFTAYYARLKSFAQYYVTDAGLAADIVSDQFVKLWQNRERLPDIQLPDAYLYTAIKNAAINHNRKIKNIPAAGAAKTETVQPVESRELQQLLQEAIARLPEKRRIIFCLIKEEGMKPAAVAAAMGLSVRTVDNQLYRAVATLSATVSNYLGYNPKAGNRKNQGSVLPIFFL